jgi:hypothetical protein
LGTIDGNSGAVVIVAPAAASAVTAKVSNASIPAYAAGISSDPTEITGDVVLPSLSIGGSGTSAADFGTFAGTTYTVYVKGNLTIDATTPFNTGSAKITVLGETTAKGALTVGADAALGKLTASGALTLAGVSNVGKLDTATYTVTSSTDTTVTLGSLDSGTGGKLSLTGNVTAVTINGGTGNVELNYTSALTLTAAKFSNTGTTAFTGSGGATFSNAATFGGAASFKSTATFNNTASFSGDVTVTDAKVITLSANAVTLAADKSVIIADDDDPVTVLTATALSMLTPGGAATLTPDLANKKLTLGAADLALTSGTLAVASGSTLEVPSGQTLSAAGTVNVTGTVSVAAGGIVAILEGGVLGTSGSGKVVFGATMFSGVGAWTASATGGSAEAGVSGVSITSAAAGATIALVAGTNTRTAGILTASGTNPTITQAAGSGNALTIAAATEINLAGATLAKVGEIKLVSGTNPGQLTFTAATSKVLVGAGTGGTPITGTNTPTIGGNTIVITTLEADDFQNDSNTKLVLLGGTTAGNFTASTTADQDVEINSTVAANGSA